MAVMASFCFKFLKFLTSSSQILHTIDQPQKLLFSAQTISVDKIDFI